MINLKKTQESIVLITSADNKKKNTIGTGFPFYREQNYTYLLTCAHVVEDVGGEENVRVNNIPVEVVAVGDIKGFDLAVLKVKDISVSPLKLMILSGEKERSFNMKIPGNFLMGENKVRRRQTITGTMMFDGETALQTIQNKEEEVAVGKLKIDKGELQEGYSGAAVIDSNTGFVLGVTTHKIDKEGKFGAAISIEALEKIWADIPFTISRQLKRESSLTQLLLKDSNLNNISPASFLDLDFSGISPETIQKAYQNSLPPDAEVSLSPDAKIWDFQGNNIAKILENMDRLRSLPEFVKELIKTPDISMEFRNQLQDKLDKLGLKNYLKENTNKSSKDFFSNKSEKRESYILVTLIPDIDEYFFLNAWLIIDDSVQDISKFQYLLDSNEKQQGILCNSTQIPKEFNKILKKALEYLRNKNRSLIIEFFLPSNLMCEEVDRWKIYDPVAEEITLGILYPIRLRSLERLNLDYLDSYLCQWREYWDKVKHFLPHKPTLELFEHLEEMESFNWKLLKVKLKEKIGLKVTCAHPESIRKDLFRAILSATTPIAIWLRNDIPCLNQETFIDEILTYQPLSNLCEAVKNMREKADANAEIDEHLGFHLAILWENPYRLPPNIMIELTTPGS